MKTIDTNQLAAVAVAFKVLGLCLAAFCVVAFLLQILDDRREPEMLELRRVVPPAAARKATRTHFGKAAVRLVQQLLGTALVRVGDLLARLGHDLTELE